MTKTTTVKIDIELKNRVEKLIQNKFKLKLESNFKAT